MIATWMIYSTIVGIALFAAASAADVIGRAVGIPTRIAWSVALIATLGVSARAIVLANRPSGVGVPTTYAPSTAVAHGIAHVSDAAPTIDRIAPPASGIQSQSLLATVASRSTSLDRPLAAGAVLLALLAVGHVLWSLWRLARLARRLPTEDHDGLRLLVSDDIGPALLGVFRPRIVVPRWWFTLPDADRRLILAHEQQHAESGDQYLLIAGTLLVALQPWNLGLWLTLSRLRLVIEVDCDRRILGAGADTSRYGALLLAVHQHATVPLRRQMAFFAGPSSLRQRIQRMTRPAPALGSGRGLAAVAALTAAIAVAYGAPRPASASLRAAKTPASGANARVDVKPSRAESVPALSRSEIQPAAADAPVQRSTSRITPVVDTGETAAQTPVASPASVSVSSAGGPDSIEVEWLPKNYPLPPDPHHFPLRKIEATGPSAALDSVLARLQKFDFFELSQTQLVAACGDVGKTVARWALRVHENDMWRVLEVPEGCTPSDAALAAQLQGLRTLGRDAVFSGWLKRE